MSEISSNNVKDFENVLNLFFKTKIKGLIILGRAGIGKTYLTLNYLNNHKIEYDLISGYITPLMFYRKLFENKDGILVCDDVLNIFENKQIISLLLSALDYTKSVVSWVSSAKILEKYGLPESFEFNGKLIIIRNEINVKDEVMRALVDRCIFFTFNLTREDVLREIQKEVYDGYSNVFEWLKNNVIDINYRVWNLAKAIYDNFKGDGWERVCQNVLLNDVYKELNEIDRIIIEIFDRYKSYSNNEKAKIFNEITGMGRATFYRHMKKLKKLGLI